MSAYRKCDYCGVQGDQRRLPKGWGVIYVSSGDQEIDDEEEHICAECREAYKTAHGEHRAHVNTLKILEQLDRLENFLRPKGDTNDAG